ncbi:MAG: PEGA domain-containing protein [Phycisphaerae bacterium]|nr:PEGA domain-containing protein [Phycisphaerae bacterium]
MLRPPHLLVAALVAVAAAGMTGCVRRTVSITSEPSGALVLVNDREVGRTPCSFDFTYYGTYDVQLSYEGYEPVSTSADANAPWWDTIPIDAVSEAIPANLQTKNAWHFTLVPIVHDREALLARARELRSAIAPEDAPIAESATDAATTTPNSGEAPATSPR